MSWSVIGGAETPDTNSPNTSGSITHGQTINSGDLVFACVHVNADETITDDESGWTTLIDSGTSGESHRFKIQWREAGASEPSSYGWSWTTNTRYALSVYVYRPSAGSPQVDATANKATSADSTNAVNDAFDGQVISDNALSLGFCGQDNADSNWTASTTDKSHTTRTQTETYITQVLVDRIYTTGETGSGAITTTCSSTPNDNWVGVHVSFTEAAGGTDIDATVDTITLTEYAATIQADVDTNISGALDTLTLSELAATVQADVDTNIAGNLATINLTPFAATIQADVDTAIDATLATITKATAAATVQADVDTNIDAALASLSLTQYAASLGTDIAIDAAVDALALTAYQGQIAVDVNISGALATITLTALQADVALTTGIQANTDALNLSALAADVQADVDTTITAQVDALTLSELAATVELAQGIQANTDTLALTEQAAQVSLDIDIVSGLATISVGENAASVQLGKSIEATLASLTLTEQAADVVALTDTNITANVASITVNGLRAVVGGGAVTFLLGNISILVAVDGSVTIEAADDGAVSIAALDDGSITIN